MLTLVYPVRIIQALLALASIAVTAFVIGTLYNGWSFSNTIYYMLFNGCWTTVVAVPYLGMAPIVSPRYSHEYVIPFIEIVTMCLWLSGWIAMAAEIPSPSACTYSSCHGLQALITVAALEWALFLLTNVFAVLDIYNSRAKRHEQKARSAATSETHSERPSMSQVHSAEEAV